LALVGDATLRASALTQSAFAQQTDGSSLARSIERKRLHIFIHAMFTQSIGEEPSVLLLLVRWRAVLRLMSLFALRISPAPAMHHYVCCAFGLGCRDELVAEQTPPTRTSFFTAFAKYLFRAPAGCLVKIKFSLRKHDAQSNTLRRNSSLA
jgi:hypothetical protein